MTKKWAIALPLMLMTVGVMAKGVTEIATRTIDLEPPVQQYQIQNHSEDTIECAQMIGGYCSDNPVEPDHATRILPDPGATEVRGHIMVMDSQPGHYMDNLIFVLKRQGSHWRMTLYDLYGHFPLKQLEFARGHG